MAGVVGTLICMFVGSGCQGSVVASALAFHPPEPMYELIQDEGTDTYRIALMSELPELDVQIASADILTTKNKTKVPIIVMRYPGARFTILYSHGNATDLGAMCYMFSLLANGLGVNVVGYDYTGYGVSQKFGVPPTEKQTYRDIERVYEYCLEQNLVSDPGRDLLLYGQSVGSGPSCYLASRKPVAGVILHSPIMSGLRVITDSRLLCCCDIFPNIDRIKAFKSPVFIIHGSKDEEVTVNHGQRLLEAAPSNCKYSPWWVPDRGHNDVLQRNEKEFIRRMAQYLEHLDSFHCSSSRRPGRAVTSRTGTASGAMGLDGESASSLMGVIPTSER